MLAIPRGGPRGGSIAGTCVTYALLSGPIERVEFVERRPLTEPVGRRSKAGWIVTLSRDGRVRSINVMGRPPQLGR